MIGQGWPYSTLIVLHNLSGMTLNYRCRLRHNLSEMSIKCNWPSHCIYVRMYTNLMWNVLLIYIRKDNTLLSNSLLIHVVVALTVFDSFVHLMFKTKSKLKHRGGRLGPIKSAMDALNDMTHQRTDRIKCRPKWRWSNRTDLFNINELNQTTCEMHVN